MIRERLAGGALLTLGLVAFSAADAARFEFAGIQASWENRVIAGATWRAEERDEDIVGKLNLNPDLCPDDCISFTGDPAPNQRLVDAPGAFVGSNYDNGNLNYDKGELVAGQTRIESELKGFWGDVAFKLSGVGFYDFENTDYEDFNPDTAFQPRFVDRSGAIEGRVGHDADVLEAFVNVPFKVFGHDFDITVGEQRLRWGESTFIARSSIDAINPPNENRLHFPGSQIASVFEPVGLAVLSTQFTSNISAEFVYQYDWEKVEPAAEGSFFSTNDLAGGGDYAVVGLGQFSEDPDQVGTFKNELARSITNTSNSVPVDSTRGQPDDGGQYGARITWFSDFNGGTEFAFHALNYHSRFPYGSGVAANRSCLRDGADVPVPGTGDIPLVSDVLDGLNNAVPGLVLDDLDLDAVTALAACGGGNGSTGLGQVLQTVFPGESREPLPLDTLGVFLDYPEDIHMFGISFNTNVGNWSLAGEYSFRPNQPLQVSIPDLVFAGLQPALPAEDQNLILAEVPGARTAVPDYVETRFRDDPVRANETIRGYEREKVGQLDFTGIRIFSSTNPIGADQIIWLVEAGMTHVVDMPDRDEVQFDGGGPNCTHYSAGADGTGAEEADSGRLNPTQARGCFADDFAWGYRTMLQISYNNLLFGWGVNPMLFFAHDVDGVAPSPIQNFVEDRKRAVIGTELAFSDAFLASINYEAFFGSGERRSVVQDRDNISLSLEYNF